MTNANSLPADGDDGKNQYARKLERLVQELTVIKKEVYDLSMEGLSIREIAEIRFVSIETIRTQRKDIVQEAKAKDFNEIRIWALKAKK